MRSRYIDIFSDNYDKGGLLKQVLHDGTRHITNITYNPRGQRENIYYGNNTKTRYYYNPLNFRLTRILTTRNNGQDILQDLNYSYDSVGNITSQTDNAQQTFYFNNQVIAPAGSYSYDSLYRLLTATGRELTALSIPTDSDFVNNIPCPDTATNAMQNYTQHYRYDALGNMLQMQSQNQWTRDYIYDTATNRLLRHTQQLPDTYSYDAHGNILTMPHLSRMSYDYQNQLINAGNWTFTSYYNYDAEGNRTRKIVVKGNVREERYYINGYEVYRKYSNDTLDFERSTVNISDDEKVFVRIETKDNESPVIRYQYDNYLGSACLELDTTGQIISYEEYHPFGTTSYRSGRSETEVSLKRYKYCGKERDEETGLYYYGMRYYAAWLCRFVSVDPLQFKYPYYTPYQYAGNKPVSYIDLDGGEEKRAVGQSHRAYLTEVGLYVYQEARKRGYSIEGSALILSLSANESGYGNLKDYESKKKVHNYFGLKGAGSVASKAKGTKEEGIEFGFNTIRDNFSTASDLLKSENLDLAKIDSALVRGRLGNYNPGNNHYATYLNNNLKIGVTNRLITIIEEKMTSLENEISVIKEELLIIAPLLEKAASIDPLNTRENNINFYIENFLHFDSDFSDVQKEIFSKYPMLQSKYQKLQDEYSALDTTKKELQSVKK